jgi:hypothetical protein
VLTELKNRYARYGGSTHPCFLSWAPLPCAVPCSPTPRDFYNITSKTTPTGTKYSNYSVYLDPSYANIIYAECSNLTAWWPVNNTLTVAQQWPTLADFVYHLGTDYEAGYALSGLYPAINYNLGAAPWSGLSFNPMPAIPVPLPENYCAIISIPTNCSISPANQGGIGPEQRNISYCAMYSNSTCCYPDSDTVLMNQLSTKAGNLVGTECCYTNVKQLHCAWLCGPDERDYVSYDGLPGDGPYLNMTVYVSEDFANGLFQSCSNVCLGRSVGLYVGGGVTVDEQYSNAEEFLKSWNSDNDPRFVPSETQQRVLYLMGPNPATGRSFSASAAAACGNDLVGCYPDWPDLAENSTAAALSAALAGFVV